MIFGYGGQFVRHDSARWCLAIGRAAGHRDACIWWQRHAASCPLFTPLQVQLQVVDSHSPSLSLSVRVRASVSHSLYAIKQMVEIICKEKQQIDNTIHRLLNELLSLFYSPLSS
jgi:hypothetical protein